MEKDFKFMIAQGALLILIFSNFLLWQYFYSKDIFYLVHLILTFWLAYATGRWNGYKGKEGGYGR